MSLGHASIPSMEAPLISAAGRETDVPCPLPAGLFGGGDETNILSHCPEFMRSVATAVIREYAAAPEAVIGAMLAVAAASLGNRFRVATRSGDVLPAAFNTIIAHRSLRHLGWLDLIQCPLVARVTEMQLLLKRDGIQATEHAITKRLADFDAAKKMRQLSQDMIDKLKLDLARMQARLRPHVLTNRLSMKMIGDHFTQAFDHSLLAVTAHTDPLDDLSTLKPAERREIAALLNQSWAGKPILLNKGVIPGTVTLLWSTPQANLGRLSVWREFHEGMMPVPILLLTSDEPMKLIRPMAEGTAWHDAIDDLFDIRCAQKEDAVYSFATAADQHLATWEEAFLAALDTVQSELARHLVWLPQLACRIALLFRITREAEGMEISTEDVQAAIAITEALGAAHLRTLTRFVWREKEGSTDAIDRTDKSAVMLAKIRKRGPISRRGLWRSYDDPRAEWFVPILAKLIHTGLVRHDEKGCLVVCENDGHGGDSGPEQAAERQSEKRDNEAV